ncbi:hypothetical protein HJA82_29585 [Rhizobium bangladeshense]|uniref:hypothetical protein n=1 Tax=Rhizobium bangladeshense TaxID=1138189 RepID=UPI001C83D902|nr:hypothetical protein [Rhizobium bangladeshense]MBX4911469.1 hypothetical protein [Rhizobium bangladeshense]
MAIQEAVLEMREGDRYFGFLVEQEEWREIINRYGFAERVLQGRNWIWRVTDRLTGNTTEGQIPFTTFPEIGDHFEQTWKLFSDSPYRPPEPEVPIEPPKPVDPYASHPNYGRF